MHQIFCDPPINEAYVFKFDTYMEACDAARAIAEKHCINVTVLREVTIFKHEITMKDFN